MACSPPLEQPNDMLARYCPDDWENLVHEMNRFNFTYPATISTPLSSPPSATFSGSSTSSSLINMHDHLDPNFTWDAPSSSMSRMIPDIDTPLATPSFDNCNGWRVDLNQADNIFSPCAQRERPHPQDWPHTPKSSPFGSIDATNTFIADPDSPSMRWGHGGSAPSPTTTFHDAHFGHEGLAAHPQNELAFKHNGTCNPGMTTIDPNITMATGLMIQLPQSPIPQSCVIPPTLSHHRSSPSLNAAYNGARRRQGSEQMPRIGERQRQGSMALRRNKTRCASTSITPKGFPGNGYNVSKRHASTSVARGAEITPRSSKLPSGGGIDFVNFTPMDSTKILTGVAPSGSSKTKARREKEAMEKRKKLSQAALQAVKEAGGDVNRLLEEGIFV